ncbi:MAG: hypothetical protein AB1757_29835 [Acidobacteriota bacterium]
MFYKLNKIILLWGCFILILGNQSLGKPHIESSIKPKDKLIPLQLWLQDEMERKNAKSQLIKLGKKAIPSLISLLEELCCSHKKAYILGREDEGQRAWKDLIEAMHTHNQRQITKAQTKLRRVDITQRLENDVIEILGKLKATAAIPQLIILMNSDIVLTKVYWNQSMRALIDIGTSSIPYLIDTLEKAEAQLKILESRNLSLVEKDNQQSEIHSANRVQKRAAMVLAAIGDEQVTPVLERVSQEIKFVNLDITPEIIELKNKLRAKKIPPIKGG